MGVDRFARLTDGQRECLRLYHAGYQIKQIASDLGLAQSTVNARLERARNTLIASFANGVIKDKAAVSAAIVSPWSNGQTEGQITKLKLVKRQMYGRGKLDLLEARVIGPG